MGTTQSSDPTDVLGRRIGAGLIDLAGLCVLFLVLGLTIGDSQTGDGRASVNLNGGPAIIFLALALLYYFACEAVGGRTLGKLLLGVRVVSADGTRAGPGQVAGRTALRLIDGILFYLVGLIVILATGQRRQRLGDLAAKTAVVRA
ncbi:MAG: RDD family protein [Actinomycetota bacterium]|nr:RDD family protein [Actinomycetota bacterium]MDQ3648347.1 RDD family protein [Actinomycetota bacterium]